MPSLSKEARTQLVEVLCPECGKVRQIQYGTMAAWAEKNNKSVEDYNKDTVCASCRTKKMGWMISPWK